MNHYLYHVIDSAGQVRYVGCSVNPYRRLLGHIAEGRYVTRNPFKTHGEAFHRWLWAEVQAGRTPDVRIVAVAAKDWRESELTETYRQLEFGVPLLNTCVRGRRLPTEILRTRARRR